MPVCEMKASLKFFIQGTAVAEWLNMYYFVKLYIIVFIQTTTELLFIQNSPSSLHDCMLLKHM